jgi:tripartite-type tricarboxylate transporter receptor subunit TctC
MGKRVLVEYKPGAISNIATEYVARAKPDGYTVYFTSGSTLAGNMHLFKKPPVNVVTDIQIAATINKQSFLIVVDAKKPIYTLSDLTAYLKQKGDKASYATGSPSGVILGALYNEKAGLQSYEVPYKGGIPSALSDLVSGLVDYAIADPIFAFAQMRQGTLRGLAIGTAARMKAAPDVPTLEEQGVHGIDVTSWWSVAVPAGTPESIVGKWNKAINEILATEETRQFLASFGSDPFISTPEQGQALLKRDVEAWGDYVRIAKIPPLG